MYTMQMYICGKITIVSFGEYHLFVKALCTRTLVYVSIL